MRRFVARLRQAPAGTLTTPLTPRSPMPPPPATPPPRPLVALVVSAMRDEEEGNTTLMRAMTSQGKPNTGKSTLFNRLVGRNRALVSATPGTTRDRLFGTMEWLDHSIDVVDTGGMYQDKEDYFASEVMEQAQLALDEAHMVVMVVDGRAPLDDKDRRVARLLQKRLSTRPVALAVNKIDNDGFLHEVTEKRGASFRNLGLGEPYYVSALHAEGTSGDKGEYARLRPVSRVSRVAGRHLPVRESRLAPISEPALTLRITGSSRRLQRLRTAKRSASR